MSAVPSLALANPLPTIVLLGAMSYGACRALLASASREMRDGWFAAAPLGSASRDGAAACLAFAFVAIVLMLFALLVLAGAPAFWGRETHVLGSFVVIVAGSAAWLTTRKLRRAAFTPRTLPRVSAAVRATPRLRIATPAQSGASSPLAELTHWQRIRTAARWRSGGHASRVALLALLVPRGEAVLIAISFILIAGALLWWLLALATARDVFADARDILAATPIERRRLVRAALRYPAHASALTLVLIGAGLAIGALTFLQLTKT